MLINREAIYESWLPMLEEKTEIKDTRKLKWLAEYCHNHTITAQQLNESYDYSAFGSLGAITGMGQPGAPSTHTGGPNNFYTGTTGSGDKFPSLLPMAIQVAARTIGFDIVSVIPMQNPVGILTYLDYNYAGGTTTGATKPHMIKINVPTPDSTFNGGSGAFTVGATYWGASSASDGTNLTGNAAGYVVELKFVGYSRIDGHPIFRVGSTYRTTGTGTGFNTDSTVNAAVTLANVFDGDDVTPPVIIMDNSGVPQVTNTAAFRVTPVTASAHLVRALEDHIQGFTGSGAYDTDDWNGPLTSSSKPADPMDRGTGETTYYRTMGLTVFTKTIHARTFQAAANVTQEMIQDLNKQFGLDVLNLLENTLINEISQSINKNILSRAFALGWSNNSELYKSDSVTLNFTLDNTVLADGTSPAYLNKLNFTETIPYRKFADFGNFENLSTLQRRIKSKVLAAGNIIMQRGRRGPANFIVTNAQIGTAIQDNAQYTFAPLNNNVNQDNGSLYPVGTLVGMTVYVDPNMPWNDTRILVGRKGADEEPGIKFMPYLMAETIQTISEPTMSPKIAVKSRYALTEAGHWPQTQYYTIYVHTGGQEIV